jgi:hypothetical protein
MGSFQEKSLEKCSNCAAGILWILASALKRDFAGVEA